VSIYQSIDGHKTKKDRPENNWSQEKEKKTVKHWSQDKEG
jgi:hypothetical protein